MTHEEYMASLPKDVAVKAIMMANIKSKHSYTDINGKRVPVGDYISLPQLQRDEVKAIALELAYKELSALWSFYGQGLEVANWHQNGDLEPLDSFFEENNFDALPLLKGLVDG